MNEDWIKFLNEVKAECEARGIPFPINIIPYDNPLEGESGYNVFAVFKDATGEVEKEVAVNPMTRFADPIKDIRIITEDIEPYLKECIDEKWSRCDDPQKLMVGFLNYGLSECRYFPLSSLKGVSTELRDYIQKGFKV